TKKRSFSCIKWVPWAGDAFPKSKGRAVRGVALQVLVEGGIEPGAGEAIRRGRNALCPPILAKCKKTPIRSASATRPWARFYLPARIRGHMLRPQKARATLRKVSTWERLAR